MGGRQFGRVTSLLVLSGVLLAAPAAGTAAEIRFASASDLKNLSIEELLNVQVTSVTRRPQTLFDTAAAVQVIRAEDIRRSGATSIPQALRMAPNLEVARIDASNWAITARGFNTGLGNKLLVMVDGRTVYTPMFAGVFWDVQDAVMADIDRIEVVSGPGGTAWGANAVNGVINVITKSAADTTGLLLEAGAGDELQSLGAIRYGGTFGPGVHYRAYGKYIDRGSSALPDGARWTDGSHLGQGGVRLDWAAGNSDSFTVQGALYDGASGQVPTANRVEYDGGNLLGRWERSLSADAGLKLQVYYDRSRRVIRDQYTDDLDTVDVDFQHRFSLAGRHDVVWGVGARQMQNHFLSPPSFAFLPAKVTRHRFSAFAQDNIAFLADRLHLTVGSKLEHNDFTGLEIQPSVSLSAKIAANQTVWSAISRAVRVPARLDHDLFIPNEPPYLIEGGPDFRSEVLVAYELGYRIQPWQSFSVDVATFYNDYDRLRSVESVAPPALFPLQVRNGLAGSSHGAELSVDYRMNDRWRLSGSYQYLDLTLRVKPGHIDATSVSAEAHDPRQQFMLRSLLDLTSTLRLDAAYRSVARIVNDAVPGYDELDVRFAWRPVESLEVAVIGQNLLHNQHAEFKPLATRHEIERSVFGKVTWGF